MAIAVPIQNVDALKIPPGQLCAVSITHTPFDGGGHRREIHNYHTVTWDGQTWDVEPEYLLLDDRQREQWKRR